MPVDADSIGIAAFGAERPCGGIRVSLVADALTAGSLSASCRSAELTPLNFRLALRFPRPDFVLVESAWQGHRDSWKYRIAAYPGEPSRNNDTLRRLVSTARDLGIPTVFWNKEDSVHFDRFIDSARLFDHIFTVDENCVPRYRAIVDPQVTVDTLMFAVQPAIHHFSGITPRYHRANFVGSYSRHIHSDRRELQHMLFEAASQELGLTVYDRNSGRKSANYRYPEHIPLEVRPAVPYAQTAQIYRDYLVSLNVNTIVDSPTMFSRRLVEILACGGLAVTTPALSVERLFAPFCHTVRSGDEARELFSRLRRDGLSTRDREMMVAGAEYVAANHTWAHRLQQICDVVGLRR